MHKPGSKRVGPTVTEGRIIAAAVQLFARQGYKGTSTRDISRLARVNEVTLFRYFPRKTQLFAAAAESRLGRLRMRGELQSRLAEDAAVREVVPLLTEFFVENFFDQPDLMGLLYVAGFEVPGADRHVREYLGPIFDSIYGYFERCVAQGKIRNVDPAIATLGLAGIASTHQSLYRLFTGRKSKWNSAKTTPAYTDFLLTALGQSQDLRSPASKRGVAMLSQE